MNSFPPLPKEDLQHILNHTASLWEEARGKSFFITGGTGFFGIWLLESFCYINNFLSLGAKATVLTRDPAAFAVKAPHLTQHLDLRFIQGDICNFTFPKEKFDYVIHAATEASAKLNNEAPYEMLDTIVAGMKQILNFTAQANVRKFLFTSSGAVYGPQPRELTHLPEDYLGAPDCLNPTSAYAEGKRIAELMIAIRSKQLPGEFKIARCFAFVGPHLPLDAHFAAGNFIGNALRNQSIQINGDGTAERSYLYAADLAVWLWTLLFKAPPNRPYNVGSGRGWAILALAEAVAASITPRLPVSVAGVPLPGAVPARYVPDVSRAAAELELIERIPLTEGIHRTLDWIRI